MNYALDMMQQDIHAQEAVFRWPLLPASVTILKMLSFTVLQGNSLCLRWFQDTPVGPGLLEGA